MIIIPARLASTRFAEKILCNIGGLPMFIATAKRVKEVDEVVIAVDDEGVAKLAKKHGFKAVLTSKEHKSGTDRINEAASILKLPQNEIIINLQADEPFIEATNIKAFKDFALQNHSAFMCSCYKEITREEAKDPNLVKVICTKNDEAIYFSRTPLPYERAPYLLPFKGHLGIYSYSVCNLKEFCLLEESSLEDAEKLEQLRAIENSKIIKMLKISTKSFGIDTKEDYEKALNFV